MSRYEVRVIGAGDMGIVLSWHWTRWGASRQVHKWRRRRGHLHHHSFWAVDTRTGERFVA